MRTWPPAWSISDEGAGEEGFLKNVQLRIDLTPEQLVQEIKEVYHVLSSLEGGEVLEEPVSAEAGGAKKPSIPLKDIVKAKYVVCLECEKKMKTLKMHLHKVHGIMPKEYYARFDLDPKKFPLVCKEYSAARSKVAKERGLGAPEGGGKSLFR